MKNVAILQSLCFILACQRGVNAARGSRRSALFLEEAPEHIGSIPKLIPSYNREASAQVQGSTDCAGNHLHAQEEDSKESEGKGCTGERPSKPVVWLLFGGAILTAYGFAMTQTARPHVSNNTILVVDNIVSIFLAVLWFQAITDLTELIPEKHYRAKAATLNALIMLSSAFAVAFALRKGTESLAWFCGCAAHICSFSSIHAASTTHEHNFSDTLTLSFGGFFVVVAVLLVIGTTLYFVKKAAGIQPGVEDDDESKKRFLERFDDVETDFGGVCLAMYWTTSVRFAVVGEFPATEEIEPGEESKHSAGQRCIMLLYVVCMLGFAAFFVWMKSRMMYLTYPKRRCIELVQKFLCVSCAFGFLVWGQMHFYEHPYWNMNPLMSRIYFAGICSFLAMVGIFLIAGLQVPMKGGRLLGLTCIGLASGLAWEQVFDAALEAEAEGSPYEVKAKIFVAITAMALILPIHAIFLKPLALQAEESEDDG